MGRAPHGGDRFWWRELLKNRKMRGAPYASYPQHGKPWIDPQKLAKSAVIEL